MVVTYCKLIIILSIIVYLTDVLQWRTKAEWNVRKINITF